MKALLQYWWVLALVALLATAYAFGHSSGSSSVQTDWDAETLVAQQEDIERLTKLNAAVITAREQTEAIRANYVEFKAGKQRETDALERAVAAGSKRLSIQATCSASGSVPSAGANTGGADTGSAILGPDARRSYYAYRRAYDEQFATLKMCRDELIKRSTQER